MSGELKYYQVAVNDSSDYDSVHDSLITDGSTSDNAPSRSVECTDSMEYSDSRSVYLLTDAEADELRNNPKVAYVELNSQDYPELWWVPPEQVILDTRYNQEVLNYRVYEYTENGTKKYLLPLPPPNGSETAPIAQRGRAGYQLLRCTTKENPWRQSPSTTVFGDKITVNNDGAPNVDIIVCDGNVWHGHVEFLNNNVPNALNPSNYVGGNVLPGNGYCDVLDLVLDSPYYIDPAWFNADPDNRLTLRWDGTIVPKETIAKAWWTNSAQRSAQFQNKGTVQIPVGYTRASCNGSPSAYPTAGEPEHGTPCASLVYGRNFGWAYNANKWSLNQVGELNIAVTFEAGFVIQKIFHQNKPINQLYGTRDPTVSSNSWSFRTRNVTDTGFAYFRNEPPIEFLNRNTKPSFMRNIGYQSSTGGTKGPLKPCGTLSAGNELVNSGVIFVCAAGNDTQTQVGVNHPDYNNYFVPSLTETINSYEITYGYSTDGFKAFPTTNRRGFPQQLGLSGYTYPVINVGALDDNMFQQGDYLDRKVNYSDQGPEIDCFAPGDGVLAAANTNPNYPRYDSMSLYAQVPSRDRFFSGTSAATPVAAGLIACKVATNRAWTFLDVRNWLRNDIGTLPVEQFYDPGAATTANDLKWNDFNNPQGAPRRVIYDQFTEGLITSLSAQFKLTVVSFSATVTGNKTFTEKQTITAFNAFSVTGGVSPLTYAVSSGNLPTGLAINSVNGVISGTPTEVVSNRSITATVTDSNGVVKTGSFLITVNAIAVPEIPDITSSITSSVFTAAESAYSNEETISVTNIGTGAVTISGINYTSSGATAYPNYSGSWGGSAATTIQAQQTKTFKVKYLGSTAGSFNNTITIVAVGTDNEVINVSNTIVAQTFSITPNVTTTNESGSVTYTIQTTNFGNGTLYWKNVGTTVAEDFSNYPITSEVEEALTSSVTITSNQGSITLSLKADKVTEGNETIILNLYKDSGLTNLLATAATVTVTDSSRAPVLPYYTVTPNTETIDEGDTVLFAISTNAVKQSTRYFWTNEGTTTASDFTDGVDSGELDWTSNTILVYRTLLTDFTSEKVETIIIAFREGSTTGKILATSVPVYVRDTSQTPTASFDLTYSTTVSEGGTVAISLVTGNLPDRTMLYWTTRGAVNAADFTDNKLSGSFKIVNNRGLFNRGIVNDIKTEGTERFVIEIRKKSIYGPIVAEANIDIIDTSLTPPTDPTPTPEPIEGGGTNLGKLNARYPINIKLS